jgi:hypothetical protein
MVPIEVRSMTKTHMFGRFESHFQKKKLTCGLKVGIRTV